jgi:hypothetical protein
MTPNQHIGAWAVGFMPQWIAREYLARRGMARLPLDRLQPARCPLLGYTPKAMQIEGVTLPAWLLRVEEQAENRTDGYDTGARMLTDFFKQELRVLLQPKLDLQGRRIIECCLDEGNVGDYEGLMPYL